MPSRRSDRGNASRRLIQKNEAKRADLEKAIEERTRWEDERDHLYRTGWENWDLLDNETRQDLVRESAVLGGLGAAANFATSPRRLGIQQGTKEFLKRIAPDLAKRVYAGSPRKAAQSLMDRLKEVRDPKNWSRANQERWNMAKAAARRENGPNTRENTKFQKRTDTARRNDSVGPQVGPPTNIGSTGRRIERPKPKTIEEALKRAKEDALDMLPYSIKTPRDVRLRDISVALNNSLNPHAMNLRDAYYRSGGDFDYIQNLSNRIVPAGKADNEVGRIREKDKLAEAYQEAEAEQEAKRKQKERDKKVDDWKKNRDWTGVSRPGQYFDLDGRPTGAAKGLKDMTQIPDSEWNKYFDNRRKEKK
jgi:hypothetical protein